MTVRVFSSSSSPPGTSPLFPRPVGSGSASRDHDAGLSFEADSVYDEELTTEMQTIFNIVNNYVGMVLLSMSFCFAAAGWLALPLLFVLTLLGGYTGALIVLSYATIANEGETVCILKYLSRYCNGRSRGYFACSTALVRPYCSI